MSSICRPMVRRGNFTPVLETKVEELEHQVGDMKMNIKKDIHRNVHKTLPHGED